MEKLVKHLFTTFIKFLDRSKKTIFLILVVAAITLVLSATISIWLSRINHLYIASVGNIKTLGVEAYDGDIIGSGDERYIDWGTVYPGTLTNRSFYIWSKSNIKTTLNLDTSTDALNWTFLDSAGKNVTGSDNDIPDLDWDYNDIPVSPNETIYVTLTLNVSDSVSFIEYLLANDVTGFSFDICIYASDQ